MKTNLLNDLSNVLKKGTSLSEKGASLNLLPKMDRECIENDSRMDRQSLGKIFRYAAMITLLLTLACGNVWAGYESLNEGNMHYTFNNSDDRYYNYNKTDNGHTAVALGTLTGSFTITSASFQFSDDWADHPSNTPFLYLIYTYDNWSTKSDWQAYSYDYDWSSYWVYKNPWGYTIATNESPSGNFSLKYYWEAKWNDDTKKTINNNGSNYEFTYTILPPAVSSFTVTPTGAVSGDGTEGNPYIIPYGGDLKLTMSGSQGHSDANSSAKYYNTSSASSWTDQAYKTISNVTETSNQSVTIKMCYENNSSSELHGTESTKTVYYKAAKGVSLYKFQTKSSGLGTDAICANKDQDYSLTTGGSGKLETLIGGTLKARASSAGTTNLVYNTSNIKFTGGSAGWLILGLDNKIKAGDVIRYVNSNSGSVAIRTAKGTDDNQIVLAGNGKTTIQTVVITDAQATAFASLNTVYMVRKSNTSEISYFEILRPYKVTLDANTNGGKVNEENTEVHYMLGTETLVLPHAFKDGYYFNGWFPNASTGDAVSNPYTPTGSTTLYAQFGDCPDEGTVYKFQVATELTNGNVTEGEVNLGNYVSAFEGGSLTAHQNSSKLTIVSNSKIQFADNNVYLKIDLDCALQTGDKFITSIETDKLCITNTGSRSTTNELVVGTKTETDVPAAFVGSKTLWIWRNGTNSKITYFEVYRPEGFAVTYHKNDGSATTQVNTVSTVEDNMFTRNGYTFVKWHTEADGTSGVDKAVGAAVTAAIDLYAIWECTTPTFGTDLSTTPHVVREGDDAVTLTVAATANSGTVTYQWYSNTSKSTSGATALTTGATYNAPTSSLGTLYYYCVANNTTGGGCTAQSAYATVTVNEVPCFEFAGGTKDSGWPVAIDGSITTSLYKTSTGAVLAGGTVVNSGTVTIGSNDGVKGLVFDAAGNNAITITLSGTHAFAVGTVITISGASGDDNSSSNNFGFSVNGNNLETTSLSTAKASFEKSYIVAASDGVEGGKTIQIKLNTSCLRKTYLKSVTVTGCAEVTGYTVSITADPDGYGSVSSSSVTGVASGTSLSTSTNTLSVGATDVTATATSASAEYTYAFSNWTKSDGTALPLTVTADLSVYANFTRTANNYTLTWNTNGGSDLDCDGCTSGSTAYGASITAPNDPTLSNYTFDGWNTANDGSGSDAAATMPAANTTYYAAWKQTVTLTTGAQGSGGNQTPYVYLNGTGVSSITPHTADGYTLQGYYTAGSGGTKVLNADGTFAGSNVTDYITSGKWSRTGAAPTLYAQWLASEDCSTSDFVIKKGSDTEYQGCMESTSYDGTATSFTAGSATTVGNAKMTISNYDGGIKRPGSGNTFSIVIEPVSGYYLKSICWAGKVENDETVSYYWDSNSGSATTITPTTTSGTGITYNAPNSTTTKFTASYVDDGDSKGGIWWRNVQVEVCAGGGTTYNVTYNDNGKTGGSVPSDATNYNYGGTVTVKGNTGELAKTNYTFAGWTTNNDGTGSSYVEDNTFSITANTTLYAKWTQAVTFDANTTNHGSTGGSATAVWNATGLTGITHATPASGYKLLGYYTTASGDGTKVLNADGTFAGSNVTDYITSGKWSRTGAAPTLYARYESAGSLIWNLTVNSSSVALGTNSKSSAFTEISTTNMTNAAATGLTTTADKKSSLTGKIESLASEDGAKYVSVSFVVADGYKFIPSSASVIIQPVGTDKEDVKLVLSDGTRTITQTKDNLAKGKKDTVILTNSDATKYMMGTATLKIFVYGAADTYRLGTPIQIDGEVEEACATMPSFTRLSYGETSYTVDDTPDNLEVVGGTNITTYLWKSNTTNDRSGGSAASGTNNTATYTPSTSSAGTTYYWCEMTNSTCGITIKTSAVGITVNEDKADATVIWSDPGTIYYGGGGYTIKATVNETAWADVSPTDLTITAPAGIRIYNVTTGETSDKKWVQAKFDIQTTFDRETYSSTIPFVVSADAKTGWNAISDQNDVAYEACAGGSGDGSALILVTASMSTAKSGMSSYWEATGVGKLTKNYGSSLTSSEDAQTIEGNSFTHRSASTNSSWMVQPYIAGVTKIRLYFKASAAIASGKLDINKVLYDTEYFGSQGDRAVVYSNVETSDDSYAASDLGWVEFELPEMAANSYCYFTTSTSNLYIYGVELFSGSIGTGGTITTGLTWSSGTADGESVTGKTQSSANFTITATRDAAATVSLGAITYSSSNTSCATVDSKTGEVTITASGTSELSTTIKATLAASGCYKKKEITYTLTIPGVSCSIASGSIELTSGSASKCSSESITLTLSGFEDGGTVKWYKGDDEVTNGGSYTITTEGATRTLTTTQTGTYSATITKDACTVRTNSITISNKSASASVTKIVDEWYVKNGRLTPDIALWTMSAGATLKSVAWSPSNETGLTCYARDSIIYLEGKEPNENTSSDIVYTLTATILDACGGEHVESSKTITITHQKNTDKHVLAFVVNGTEKGGFTEGLTAAQTTDVPLYKTIAANFDVQATNCYASDDEKKVKQYYSQYDILCITDYPNSNKTGANSKKYVDVLGKLIDVRPILTMEAFVSDKANWKAKGISGNPKSPTTRQYSMDLQCKDHEIFSGTNLVKVGEGDETMYRVTMVAKDSDDYKTLDETYGAGAHAEKSGYEYGSKPALQGFTFSSEMLEDGLLPLGLIDDGAGNDLQVGIERQNEMTARLMVIGINSYAMERLTKDGQTVVINALNYLMKKNEEDIADCSVSFVGGAEGDGESTNWNNDANWMGGVKPDKTTREIRILAPVVIADGDNIHAQAPIKIASSGTYNGGADNATGSITINAGGVLRVDGKVVGVTAPAYSKVHATDASKLVLNTSDEKQSAFILKNEEGLARATVNFYSLGRTNASQYQFQYMAIPMEYVDIHPAFSGKGIYTYVYHEATGWERRGYYSYLEAFEGVGITTKFTEARTYTMTGTLASTEEREITLTKTAEKNGDNLIGNSWTAPIQISELEKAETTAMLASKTVYIYCAGHDGASVEYGTTETPGQWLAIPFNAAGFSDWTGLKVIPAMNAFELMATAGGTITLNYDTLVRGGELLNLTEKARTPRRMASHEGIELTRIRVSDTKTHTDLHLFEGDGFSEEFDDGWEAEYMEGDGISAQFYAVNGDNKMAVLADQSLEGTVLGFAPGQELTYTFSFAGEDNGYYLNDIKLETATPINEAETYTFTYEEGDTNRFYISRTAINAPQVTTGMGNTGDGVKAKKILYNDKLYIIVNGRVYSADGAIVK